MRTIVPHLSFALAFLASSGNPVAAQTTYCIPQHGGQIVMPILTSVSLGSINNSGTSAVQIPSGYSDFTSLQTALVVGTPYTITIGSGDSWPHNFAAWIDMDHDRRFSDAERIGLAQMGYGAGTISFSFTLPADALNGPTRMRVRGVEEPFGPWNLSNDPCIPFTYGEAEDYTVVISGGGSSDAALTEFISPVSAVGLGLEPVVVRVENRGTSNLSNVQIQLTVDGIASPVETVPGTLAPGGVVDHTFLTLVDHVGLSCRQLSVQLIGADARPDNNVVAKETCRLDAVTGSAVWYIHSDQFQPMETYTTGTTNETTLNTVFGQGNWQLGYFETLDVAQVFGPGTCTIFMDGSFLDVDPMIDFLSVHGAAIEDWVASGGKLFLNSSPDSQDPTGHVKLDLGFDGVSLAQAYSISYAQPYGSHLIHSGAYQPIGNEWTAFYYANGVIHGEGLTKVNVENNDAHFNGPEVDLPTLAEKSWGMGTVLFGTIGPSQLFGVEAMNDRANILAYITGCSISTDIATRDESAELVAFPNPTRGLLRIRSGAGDRVLSISVRDLLGNTIESPYTLLGDEVRINADAFAAGTYIVSVLLENKGSKHVMFIKE